MLKHIFITLSLFCMFSCNNVATKTNKSILELRSNYQDVFKEFTKENDTLYVVNFWATWCQPCVEELSDFMKINQEFKDTNFKMILVSLDKESDFDTKVKEFIKTNEITTDVYVLTDNKRMNEWIPKINPHWSGAIPATAIYKNGKQIYFTEGKILYNDLKNTINKLK